MRSDVKDFARLEACVREGVLCKSKSHKCSLILFRIKNLPSSGFPSTCLVMFIQCVHSFIYLHLSVSFPLFFLSFILAFFLPYHILSTCTQTINSDDMIHDDEDQGAVHPLRVVNSNSISQTHTHTHMHAHAYIGFPCHMERLALPSFFGS